MSSFFEFLAPLIQESSRLNQRLTVLNATTNRLFEYNSGMWLVGHSLKDLGSKETFIVKLGDDIKNSMETVFNNRWGSARNLI